MSKFNTGSSFFKRNTYQLDIPSKPTKSTKQAKKDKSKKNINKSNRISDEDFNELMNENFEEKNKVKFIDYLNKITSCEIVDQLIREKLIGKDLVIRLESETISGSQLLKGILKNNKEPTSYNWVQPENYGLALSNILSNDSNEQLLCLFLIQDYSRTFEFPKITYKDKQVYYLKTIFQLLFTNDIIEESTFWKWQDLLVDIVDIDDDTKNKICVQTAEFFNILKLTFNEEDYVEGEGEREGEGNRKEDGNIENKNHQNVYVDESEYMTNKNTDTKLKIPEEQDYNMDDDNFNLDDI